MKKIIAWLLVVVLTAGVAIGGTLAYLTDRDSEANVFTVGDVNIDLNEDFDQGTTLTPGMNIEKKPTVANKGPNKAWVWTTVAVPANLTDVISFSGKGAGWGTWTKDTTTTSINNKDYVLYTILHTSALDAGSVTDALFSNVALSSSVDVDPDGNWHTVVGGVATDLSWDSADGNPVIYVSAYAIQFENFSTVEEAYAAYNIQWGDQGAEYGDPSDIVIADGCMAGCIRYVAEGESADVYKLNCDRIHPGVFDWDRTHLSHLIIHEGIRILENRSLAKSPTLTSVILPSSLEIIEQGAFQQSNFKTLEIPENVTYIGKTAMGACHQLESIVIKAKNVTIANYMARDCANLREVYIYSDSVTFAEDGNARQYFTNKQTGDASKITFYVSSREMADTLYNAATGSHSDGMLIKSLDGSITYYNTLK